MNSTISKPVSSIPSLRAAGIPPSLANHQAFERSGVSAITILGGQCCGKTSLIEKTVEYFHQTIPTAVVVVSPSPEPDARDLGGCGNRVVSVKSADLNPSVLSAALRG